MKIDLPPNRIICMPQGELSSPIALVGEQPGRMEIQQRRPFVGPSGRVLDECLASAQLQRSSCYITNVVKDLDHPISHYINIEKGVPKISSEGSLYIEYLREELEKCDAKLIVAIGGTATYALTERTGVTKWRGSFVPSTLLPGRTTLITLHPATVLPPKGVYTNKHLITADLRKARSFIEGTFSLDLEREIKINPTFYEIQHFLESLLEGHVVDFDIEVVGEELYCIAFCDGFTSLCIPFFSGSTNHWDPRTEVKILKMIAAVIENEKIPKRGQNLGFDSHFLLFKYGMKIQGAIHDTMIAQKITYPDFPAGLDFITAAHTNMPYYKADGKKWMKVGGAAEEFWTYNALDAVATSKAAPSLTDDLIRQKNYETYQAQCSIIRPLVFMMEHGIRVDVTGMLEERDRTDKEIEKKKEELNELVGREINYLSPKQLMDYFYVEKKIKPYLKRGEGGSRPSIDEIALKRLSRKGFKEAEIILDLRGLAKRKGTYLNVAKVDKDGRFRSSYNPVGARTGRLSSSENIFGTGGNQQNWPHDLLKYFYPDEGHLFYSFDLSQIENRIVAYVGRVIEMIEAFEAGIDLHSLTASLIFSKPITEISDEPGSTHLGGGKYSERFWGKKANHGLNYGLGYRKFALYYEIPENDAEFIVERYHKAYPGVRQNYHAMIKSSLSRTRTITNLFGRNRTFLDQWGDSLFKEAYAHLPQSTTADKINRHGLSFIYGHPEMRDLILMNQIHDSIGFSLPTSIGFEKIAHILMLIKNSLETPLTYNERTFAVPADLQIGLTLFKEEGREIKGKNFPASEHDLAQRVKEIYEELNDRRGE